MARSTPPVAGPRPCSHPVHDHPLPADLKAAADEASRRRRDGWGSVRCPEDPCIRWGWTTPENTPDDSDPTGGR